MGELPDRAVEGVRYVGVVGAIEGQRIEAGIGDRSGLYRGLAGIRIDVEYLSGAEVENQQIAERRIKGEPEHMRTRSLNGDLPDDIAARADDEQHGVPGERTVGIEAERRNVDVAVGSDREALDAALHVLGDVRQHGQHVDWAALPRARRQGCENSDRYSERGNADLES